jgi:flagellar protein FlbD
MIALTRPNGHPIIVSSDLIETIESADDGTTVIVLTTGNTLAVNETPAAVGEAVVAFRRRIAAPAD